MSLAVHTASVPSKAPDFFLASTTGSGDGDLSSAVAALRRGPGTADRLQIDTRLTTRARDQSSLAALNIAGLLTLNSTYVLAMGTATVAIFISRQARITPR